MKDSDIPSGSHMPSPEASAAVHDEDHASVLTMATPGLIHDALERYAQDLDTPDLLVDLSSDKNIEMAIDDATWPARFASFTDSLAEAGERAPRRA